MPSWMPQALRRPGQGIRGTSSASSTTARICFFCNRTVLVPRVDLKTSAPEHEREQRPLLSTEQSSDSTNQSWECPLCGSSNIPSRSEPHAIASWEDAMDGDGRNQPILASTPNARHDMLSDTVADPSSSRRPSSRRPIFCRRCQTNQQVRVSLLSTFDPAVSDEASFAAFKADLDERYPLVCSSCWPSVEAEIDRCNKLALRESWRQKMERNRLPSVTFSMTDVSPGSHAPVKRASPNHKAVARSIRTCVWLMGPICSLSAVSSGKVLSREHLGLLACACLLNVLFGAFIPANVDLGEDVDEIIDSEVVKAQSERTKMSRWLLRRLHSLSAIECIFAALPRATISTASIIMSQPSVSGVQTETCISFVMLLLVILQLIDATRLFSPYNRYSRSLVACGSGPKTQSTSSFDSLIRGLATVTDQVLTVTTLTHKNEGYDASRAVFGKTDWTHSPSQTPQGLEPLKSNTREQMDLDTKPELQVSSEPLPMDWQPEEPSGQHAKAKDWAHPSRTGTCPGLHLGPQRFFPPEASTDGLDSVFGLTLSLSDNPMSDPSHQPSQRSAHSSSHASSLAALAPTLIFVIWLMLHIPSLQQTISQQSVTLFFSKIPGLGWISSADLSAYCPDISAQENVLVA